MSCAPKVHSCVETKSPWAAGGRAVRADSNPATPNRNVHGFVCAPQTQPRADPDLQSARTADSGLGRRVAPPRPSYAGPQRPDFSPSRSAFEIQSSRVSKSKWPRSGVRSDGRLTSRNEVCHMPNEGGGCRKHGRKLATVLRSKCCRGSVRMAHGRHRPSERVPSQYLDA